MSYFHASRNVYQIGDVIRVPEGDQSHAFKLSLELGMQWREKALEDARNNRASSRRSAVYAANTLGNAARFLVSQPDEEGRPVLGYEVEITHQSPSPMALIGYIDAHGTAFPSLSACIEEYWTPTKKWRFLEFVCPFLTVTAALGNIREEALWIAGENYEYDRQLARHLWGQTPDRGGE